MARGIAVYREDGGEALYDEPVGSEAIVREYWSGPAASLGLPLIASIYEHGFYHGNRWAGPELARVLAELEGLQVHWSTAGLAPELAQQLAERAGYLRAAVALAESCGGFVSIS